MSQKRDFKAKTGYSKIKLSAFKDVISFKMN